MTTVWTTDLLDALRQIGDPTLDKSDEDPNGWEDIPVRGFGGQGERPEPTSLLRIWRASPFGAFTNKRGVRHWYWVMEAEPIEARQLRIAHDLFAVYGGEIGASLLLASLPNAYAAEAGAAVLASTGQLRSNTRRRIGETSQLVIDVLFPEEARIDELRRSEAYTELQPLLPQGRGHRRVLTTRLTHAIVRELVGPVRLPNGGAEVAINQEDLLGTLGTFTVTTLEVMQKLGVPWNDEAEHAYLMLWDRVGELLGIGTKEVIAKLPADLRDKVNESHAEGLRPQTVAEARELQELIRRRVWPAPRGLGPFDAANGKLLVRALLDELQAAMPRGLERLPLVVMRYLVHSNAHEILGLGGGGVPDSVMQWPSVERFTRGGRRIGAGVIERTMRVAANDISRRAFIHFIRERQEDKSQANFWFPVASFEDTMLSGAKGGTGPA